MKEKIDRIRNELMQNPETISLLDQYLALLSNSIDIYIQNEDVDTIDFIFDDLTTLLDKYPTNKTLLLTYGQTVLNTLPFIFLKKTIIQSKKIINIFREKAQQLDNIILIEFLAMILVNAIYDFGLVNHVGSITEYSLELSDLTKRYPKNEKIMMAGARGMMNVTLYFMQKKDISVAKHYYEILLKILHDAPIKDIVDSRQLQQLKNFFGE